MRRRISLLDGTTDWSPWGAEAVACGLGGRAPAGVGRLDPTPARLSPGQVARRLGVWEARVRTAARPDAFSESDVRFLEAVSRWVGDVAYRAELTEQLTAQAAEQARRAAADELIAILAHDLRNYLTPLGARLQLIGRRAQQDEPHRDLRDLAAARTVLDRLQRLIADLLDSARLEHGIFRLSPEPSR